MADTKKVLLFVGLGCGLLLLLGVCGVGACAYFMKEKLSGPHGAAHGLLKDLREGNDTAALQRMSATYQASHTLPAFQQNVAAHPDLRQHTDATLTNVQMEAGLTSVSGFLTTPNGNAPVRVQLSQVGEHWYVETIYVRDQPLL